MDGIAGVWEAGGNQYGAFEAELEATASEVDLHGMPGGQLTNRKEQARALGLEHRWHDVAKAYASVNQMFGDIVKVNLNTVSVFDYTSNEFINNMNIT